MIEKEFKQKWIKKYKNSKLSGREVNMEKIIIEKILGIKLYDYQYKLILALGKCKELKKNDINTASRARTKISSRKIQE